MTLSKRIQNKDSFTPDKARYATVPRTAHGFGVKAATRGAVRYGTVPCREVPHQLERAVANIEMNSSEYK